MIGMCLLTVKLVTGLFTGFTNALRLSKFLWHTLQIAADELPSSKDNLKTAFAR
jgi:hypothetical protein